ncbi:unnamed protein product [Heligmosomoides polygyrus]|uniref:Hexosyltransferase n=1 Tax=Heligmosomoides polygyrus TaxID=6339 RepID=A0A3P7WGR6_HELPZ|nr:unnamed protein product [Heligmosomoides polygyrus]
MMLHRETEYNQRSQGTRAKVAEPTVLEHIWPEKSYSYRNYVRQHCMSVRVVLKLDDDVVWNVDSMIKYLSQIDDGGNMVLHCRSQKRIFVVRNVTSRYLHPKEYPYRHFPEYCISGASAATPQTIAALAEASNTVPYVWIDDVWSLGLVPRKVGATFHSMPYGGIKGFFDPFLNGSVIAQDFKRQEEGLYLFTQVNGKLL